MSQVISLLTSRLGRGPYGFLETVWSAAASWLVLALFAVLVLFPTVGSAMDLAQAAMLPPATHSPESKRRDVLECRPGYLFGTNRLQFRDGDNAHIPPSVQDVYLSSAMLGAEVRKFLSKDIGIRAQGSINVPGKSRNEFLLFDGDAVRLGSWKTRYQTVDADVGLVYDFGLGVMPYDAGLLAGFKYQYFEYCSDREDKSGPFRNAMHVLIPNLGFYYVNSDLAGFRVRFDWAASPAVLSRVFGDGYVGDSTLRVDGHSLTGAWYEASFVVSAPVTEGFGLGVSCRYNYLEITGGATLNSVRRRDGLYNSTRFSMDSRHHLFVVALSGAYAF
ncbi:MAG: hypothetical protein AB1646_25270 [Thermodesulfobacteriota bacterium]